MALEVKNKKSYNKLTSIIQLEATKLFLEKNENLDLLQYSNGVLNYNNNLLLDKLTSYSKFNKNSNIVIQLCLKDTICQKWYFKK